MKKIKPVPANWQEVLHSTKKGMDMDKLTILELAESLEKQLNQRLEAVEEHAKAMYNLFTEINPCLDYVLWKNEHFKPLIDWLQENIKVKPVEEEK
jgi:hypothetical protein